MITISLFADKLEEEDSVKLSFVIKDTGTGVKSSKFGYLFDDNEADDDSFSGAGLGLVLTKKLVKYLNGNITYTSELGNGTTFRFSINQKVASLEPIGDINSLYEEKNNDFSYFDCSNYRLLVIDDNNIDVNKSAPYTVFRNQGLCLIPEISASSFRFYSGQQPQGWAGASSR